MDALEGSKMYFVEDIRRATGLESKALRKALNALLKHDYLEKNDKGQWYVSVIGIAKEVMDTHRETFERLSG